MPRRSIAARPAREEATASQAYVGTRETVDALGHATKDPDVRLRFWALFALGGKFRTDPRALSALESVLDDHESPAGNWWSVGREALAMLQDREQLNAEIDKVLAEPAASEEDRRWAESYRSST